MTKKIDYSNFSNVADLAVERVKLKNVESPKFCETHIAKRRWLIHLLRCVCVLRTGFEKRRRSTSETMLVDKIKRKKYKNKEKCRKYVIRNQCLECLLEIVCNVSRRMSKI